MLILAVPLAGCGDYEPPLARPAASAPYEDDLKACQSSGRAAADAEVKKRGHTFFAYPVSFPLAERRLITACMHAHGYTDEN